MKVKLFRRILREAKYIFEDKLTRFTTQYGRVIGLGYARDFNWAFDWMFRERLDYDEDRHFMIHKIARLLWKRELRDMWKKKIKREAKQ